MHVLEKNRMITERYSFIDTVVRSIFLPCVPLILSLLLVGCGRESVSTVVQLNDSQPTSVSEDVSAVQKSDSDSGSKSIAVAEVVAIEAPTATEQSKAKVLPKAKDVAKLVPVIPVKAVEPTPDQLSRWTPSPFEPLQLLACRDSARIGFVSCMVSLSDGQQFVLAGTKVTLWSISSEAPEHVFLDLEGAEKDRFIKSLAISPDGKWLAAGDSEGLLRIWNVADRTELISKQLYPTGITQIAFSLDAEEIATTTYLDEVTVSNAQSLEQKIRFKVNDNGLQRILYIAPNQLVAAAEKMTLWNSSLGKLEETISPGRYNFTLTRSLDNQWFAYGDKEGLHFWKIAEGKNLSKIDGDYTPEQLAEFSPDGKYLALAGGSDIRILDAHSHRTVQVIDHGGWAMVGIEWLPKTNLLVVASEIGRTRIWGTPQAGESFNLKPMHVAVEMPDSSSHDPASATQLLNAIDLRVFPKLPGGRPSAYGSTDLSYTAPVQIEEAKLYYRYMLGKAGWAELPLNPLIPDQLEFRKNSFMLWVSFYKADESNTNISLVSSGNYNVRWASKFDAAPIEVTFENDSTSMYSTEAELLQIETNLLRKMHQAGWTAYTRLHASHNEEPDARNLEFVRNSSILSISIGKFPVKPSSYIVQYGKRMTIYSLPIPGDSGFVEFDGVTEPYMVATTKMSLKETSEFYDKEMVAQGWLPREMGRSIKDDHHWLAYIRGQRDVSIGLVKQDNGRTLIRVGKDLEKSSWQLAKEKTPDDSNAKIVGIEAVDFPILEKSKPPSFDANAKSLEIQVDATPLINVGEQYTKLLETLGWKKKSEGIMADDYVFLTFGKERSEIDLRARLKDGNAVANIQGSGLLWTKPLPGGQKRISYEAWLRLHRKPASLDWLDEYETEMQKIK
ncbi:MAG: hypothetical protein SGI77_25505 [Pirellulaceae bacterium]|nr:hypothetical protein [Pirellulaceae bacterium]